MRWRKGLMPELPTGTVTFLFTNIEGGGGARSAGPVPGRFGRGADSGGGEFSARLDEANALVSAETRAPGPASGSNTPNCFPVSPLIDACAAIGIRPIVARTERTLVNMADGYSRATNGRRLGVATVQHGPGAENAYAGVAQAFADGSPVLFLPGGY